ncbi:MAG: hypothetical protein ACR650_01760 [Methylocystis sp.]|jgi:hypothetical protein
MNQSSHWLTSISNHVAMKSPAKLRPFRDVAWPAPGRDEPGHDLAD